MQQSVGELSRRIFRHGAEAMLNGQLAVAKEGFRTLFRDANSIKPNFAYNYEDLGLLYVQLNQPEEAERAYQQAIERDPFLVNSYLGLAKLYRQAGRESEAIVMLDHAVSVAPQGARGHYVRAQVLSRLQQPGKTRQEFATAAR